METIIKALAQELGQKEIYVENVVRLIDEGATIPFIARYRKELHGAMDDQLLRRLADRLQYLRNLDQRRGEVAAAIQAQGKLTEELAAAIAAAADGLITHPENDDIDWTPDEFVSDWNDLHRGEEPLK